MANERVPMGQYREKGNLTFGCWDPSEENPIEWFETRAEAEQHAKESEFSLAVIEIFAFYRAPKVED